MRRSAWVLAALVVLAVLGWFMLRGGEPRRGERLSEGYQSEPTINVEVEKGQMKKMKAEDYIAGVVAGEMEKGWPLEAYKAQAILARSYAVNILTEGGKQSIGNGAIRAEHTRTQAYDPEKITPIIRKAVEETRGMIMTYKGYPIKAYFHSASGGRTARAEDAGLVPEGQEPPYIDQVDSPGEDKYAPPEVRSWEASFNAQEVAQAVKNRLGKEIGTIQAIQITKKDNFGRAVEVVLIGDGGTRVTVKAAELRLALGPERMRSTLLKRLEIKDGRVLMAGNGFGHGVGLSQYGAYAMAKEGAKAEQIVKHYFPKVEVRKIWP